MNKLSTEDLLLLIASMIFVETLFFGADYITYLFR